MLQYMYLPIFVEEGEGSEKTTRPFPIQKVQKILPTKKAKTTQAEIPLLMNLMGIPDK